MQIINISAVYRVFLLVSYILVIKSNLFSQELPLGYISYFAHSCNNETLFASLLPEFEQDYMIVKEEGQNLLRIKSTDDTILSKSFPRSRSVIDNLILGDYILEFEVRIVFMDDYDTAGFCFLGPVKSRENYYSLIFSKDTLKFFAVSFDSIQAYKSKVSTSLNPLWNKIRIERDILTRTLHITINNDTQNIISFSDRTLVMGYIGFGSHQSVSYVRNIRLWAPTAIVENSFQW